MTDDLGVSGSPGIPIGMSKVAEFWAKALEQEVSWAAVCVVTYFLAFLFPVVVLLVLVSLYPITTSCIAAKIYVEPSFSVLRSSLVT